MDSQDRVDQRSDGGLMKNKSAGGRREDEVTAICNGDGGDEECLRGNTTTTTTNNKRKASPDGDGDIGGKRAILKTEDQGRSEIPAHHARRPPNGFLLFCKRHRDIVSAKNPNLENRGVTKLLGNWWRTLEEDERDKYKELARQNKEIFIANNPQFTWYKLPAPPLRTLVTRPSNRRPPKLEPGLVTGSGPITPGKLADESQLGGLTSLLSSSVSPPTTPLTSSPPITTTPAAAPPPKKRFLLQTRTKKADDEAQSLSESDDAVDVHTGKVHDGKPTKKKRIKKKINAMKIRRNAKLKANDSLSEKAYLEGSREESDMWKSKNGCTQQQLIEKIVDSTFDDQKHFQDFDVQRTLDYINTEHTYQKNPTRCWQQQQQPKHQKCEKRDECLSRPGVISKGDKAEGNIISPNLNNNTIVLSSTRQDDKNGISYSFNDNNNLIVDYVDTNQRKMIRSSIQTNHDRMRTNKVEDGYIPGGEKRCVDEALEDCDNKSKRLADQKKPFTLAQDEIDRENGQGGQVRVKVAPDEEDEDEDEDEEDGDGEEEDDEEDVEEEEEEGDDDGDDEDEVDEDEDEESDREEVKVPKNCDRESANFQSILGKVSREIVSMIKERVPQDGEDMAVARFNVRSRSETDSDGSWYEKSDGSPPESPGGGRRSKRSCKGQRYEQFIKDSVSKKRGKGSGSGSADGGKKSPETRGGKRKKSDKADEVGEGEEKAHVKKVSEFLSMEKEFAEKTKEGAKPTHHASEDLNVTKQGTKASDIIQLKLDLELKLKKEQDDRSGRKYKDRKVAAKKKPISKVQMIKEKKEVHVGDFNLNEKIEELPLLSFESFLQKKRQRKKRLLGLKKESAKSKVMKHRLERLRAKPAGSDASGEPGSGQCGTKPDFADLTTLAETALTLLSLREPR